MQKDKGFTVVLFRSVDRSFLEQSASIVSHDAYNAQGRDMNRTLEDKASIIWVIIALFNGEEGVVSEGREEAL